MQTSTKFLSKIFQIPNNAIDNKFLNLIKTLFDGFLVYEDNLTTGSTIYNSLLDKTTTFYNLELNVSNLTRNRINPYLDNLIDFIYNKDIHLDELSIDKDSINYIVVLTELLKGSDSVLNILKLIKPLGITSIYTEYETKTVSGVSTMIKKVIVKIGTLETRDIDFLLDQLKKTIFSLLITEEITITIDKLLISVTDTLSPNISKPIVLLDSNYEYKISE